MVIVNLYSISVASLPWEDRYHAYTLLWGYTKEGRTVLIRIKYDFPHVLILPNIDDIQKYNNEDYFEHLVNNWNNENNKCPIHSIQSTLKTPCIGFTNSRKDCLLELKFESPWHRKSILEKLQQDMKLDLIRLECILQESESIPQQLLHKTNSQLHTTIEINEFQYLNANIAHAINIEANLFRSSFKTIAESCSRHPNMMFVSMFASSSLATRFSRIPPNPDKDPLTIIAYQFPDSEPESIIHPDERILIQSFLDILHNSNVHVIVFCSDDDLKPTCLHYISRRIQLLQLPITLSKIAGVIPLNKKLDYLSHPGLERIDLREVLAIQQCKPRLMEFSLLHAVRHPNLITENNMYFQDFYNRNYQRPNVFTHGIGDIANDLKGQVRIMQHFTLQKGILPNAMATAKIHDVTLTSVIEQGNQQRIFSCLLRHWYNNNLYFNYLQLKQNTYQETRSNAESSFPHPPWLENPDLTHFFDCTKEEEIIQPQIASNGNPFANRQKPQTKKATKTKKSKETYGGGLVLNPIEGFYRGWRKMILTCDWKAMYPNAMIAFSICTMGFIYDSSWVKDPRCTLEYMSRNDMKCDVRVVAYDGKPIQTYLPAVIRLFLDLREKERELGKISATKEEKLAHAQAELAYKCAANSGYGFFGSRTSPITMFALASWVTNMAQHMQRTMRYTILNNGGAVLGGDTDSCQACFRVSKDITDEKQIKELIWQQGIKATQAVSQHFHPNQIIVEAFKLDCLLLKTKKTYVARENGTKLNVKGMLFIKRDHCGLAQTTIETLANKLTECKEFPLQEMLHYFAEQLKKIPWHPIQSFGELEPCMLSAELNKEEGQGLSVELARQWTLERGWKPQVGDRMPFARIYLPDSNLKHVEHIRPIDTIINQHLTLDVGYYLHVQLLGCLTQLFSLAIHQPILHAFQRQLDMCFHKWQFYMQSKQLTTKSMRLF